MELRLKTEKFHSSLSYNVNIMAADIPVKQGVEATANTIIGRICIQYSMAHTRRVKTVITTMPMQFIGNNTQQNANEFLSLLTYLGYVMK